MDTVYEALLRNRRFKGFYNRQGEDGKELEINPLGLVFNDPVVYVVGTCWEYKDVRLMALHRFITAELLDIAAVRQVEFNLQSYIDAGALGFNSQPGKNLHLVARFTVAAAAHLRESRLASDQTIAEDGNDWVRLEATVADTDQLRWWLLGFGAQVEVVKPMELRAEIRETLMKQVRLYGMENDGLFTGISARGED